MKLVFSDSLARREGPRHEEFATKPVLAATRFPLDSITKEAIHEESVSDREHLKAVNSIRLG